MLVNSMLIRTVLLPPLVLIASLAMGCSRSPSLPDFSGLWQVADKALVVRPDVNAKPEDYTPEARTNLDDYRDHWDASVDDPAKFCVRLGMPNTMISRARDYVVDITQTLNRVIVLVEYQDNHRVIHFDTTQVPENVTPSNNGYSWGRWDGNSLVIETTALKARSPVGLMQRSEDAHITERWTLRKDAKYGEVLDVAMTVNDPKVFLKPAIAHQLFKRAPAGTQLNEYGCADALWDDHVAAVAAARSAGAARRAAK